MIQHAVDITAEYQAQQRSQLIARELDHRVKNLLAVVGSIGRQTAKTSTTIDGFLASFTARLDAIARTHSLLAGGQWQGTDLGTLLDQELAAFGAADGSDGLTVSGPLVFLRPREAQTLAMTLHELATNAAKHGALSQPGGRLSVTWQRRNDGGFEIVWHESGLEVVPVPASAGFGTMIIDRVTPAEFGGTTERTFTDDGMVWRLVVPAERR
jgi:two-component sensor histidine kinase